MILFHVYVQVFQDFRLNPDVFQKYPRLDPTFMDLNIPGTFPSFRTHSTSSRIDFLEKLMKRVWLLMGIMTDENPDDPRFLLNLRALANRVHTWSVACILVDFSRQSITF